MLNVEYERQVIIMADKNKSSGGKSTGGNNSGQTKTPRPNPIIEKSGRDVPPPQYSGPAKPPKQP